MKFNFKNGKERLKKDYSKFKEKKAAWDKAAEERREKQIKKQKQITQIEKYKAQTRKARQVGRTPPPRAKSFGGYTGGFRSGPPQRSIVGDVGMRSDRYDAVGDVSRGRSVNPVGDLRDSLPAKKETTPKKEKKKSIRITFE